MAQTKLSNQETKIVLKSIFFSRLADNFGYRYLLIFVDIEQKFNISHKIIWHSGYNNTKHFRYKYTKCQKLEIHPRLLESAQQNLTTLPYPATQSRLPSPFKP